MEISTRVGVPSGFFQLTVLDPVQGMMQVVVTRLEYHRHRDEDDQHHELREDQLLVPRVPCRPAAEQHAGAGRLH